jgi:tRNA nucleotidyltransferase/poly(A) polymerase
MEDILDDIERRITSFEETTIPMLSIKFGRSIRECIDIKVERRVKEELSKILLSQKDRDARIFKLMEQVDSLECAVNELTEKLEKIQRKKDK